MFAFFCNSISSLISWGRAQVLSEKEKNNCFNGRCYPCIKIMERNVNSSSILLLLFSMEANILHAVYDSPVLEFIMPNLEVWGDAQHFIRPPPLPPRMAVGRQKRHWVVLRGGNLGKRRVLEVTVWSLKWARLKNDFNCLDGPYHERKKVIPIAGLQLYSEWLI